MLTFFTGDLLVAGIFPIYAEVNTDIFLEAAADLINRGYWSEEFVGEHSHVCVYLHNLSGAPHSPQSKVVPSKHSTTLLPLPTPRTPLPFTMRYMSRTLYVAASHAFSTENTRVFLHLS